MMKEILGLRYSPIAIKFMKELPPHLEKFAKKPMRACQMLMEAKHGNTAVLTPENTSCPAAMAAFNFAPLPEKISSGKMLCNLGLFLSEEAGRKTMKEIPRLKEQIRAVLAMPLEKADFEPDVVVIEDKAEIIMWLLLADIYREGGRHSLSTSVIQACCVDVTAYVYLHGKTNASFGCYGCREASDLKDDEAMIGIPYNRFEAIEEAIRLMREKRAIDRVRKKGIYKIYKEREVKNEG